MGSIVPSVNSTQPQLNLPRLRRALKRHGILQRRLASEAGVTKFMVSHVLAGRAKSARVVATARRLISEAKTGNSKQVEA